MSGKCLSPALDWFRLLAAFLVVCNHTSPLDSFAPGADFWLTRVLAPVPLPLGLGAPETVWVGQREYRVFGTTGRRRRSRCRSAQRFSAVRSSQAFRCSGSHAGPSRWFSRRKNTS